MFGKKEKGVHVQQESVIETLDQEHTEKLEEDIDNHTEQSSAIEVICSILTSNFIEKDIQIYYAIRKQNFEKYMSQISFSGL